jgi:FkbM family methyltransferase
LICTDVLEHVEPECVEAVLDDLCRVTMKAALVTVATRPAVKVLADGRNAHLSIHPLAWWKERLLERFDLIEVLEHDAQEFCVLLRALHCEVDLSSVLGNFKGLVRRHGSPHGETESRPTAQPGPSLRGNASKVVKIRYGGVEMRFNCPNQITSWRVETLFQKEPITISWLERMERGSVLLDVGANVGMYTIFGALQRDLRVIALEPESQNFALLNSNIQTNQLAGKVVAYPLAASDRSGPATLHLSEFNAGSSCHSAGEPVGFDLKPRTTPFTQGCFCVTLDELISSGTIPVPDYLKVDVDGFEHKVLAGGMTLLANMKLRSILIELNTHLEEHREVIKLLGTLGFSFDPAQVQAALRISGAFEGVGEFVFSRTRSPLDLNFGHAMEILREQRSVDVLDHVLHRSEASRVETTPFPYMVIDNVFPPDYYAEMIRMFPAGNQLTSLNESGRVKPGAYAERSALLFDSSGFAQLTPEQAKFWGEVSGWLHSRQFVDFFVRKFNRWISARLGAQGSVVRSKGDTLLVDDATNYAIGPHTDAPHRLVTFLMYLPDDESLSEFGTSLYAPKDPDFRCWQGLHHPFEKFDRISTVAFKPNRLLVFPKTDLSFHGVEPVRKAGVHRRLLINNIRLLEPVSAVG